MGPALRPLGALVWMVAKKGLKHVIAEQGAGVKGHQLSPEAAGCHHHGCHQIPVLGIP